MSGSPGTGGSNPRKFSEKIALHNQKQAEETRAFEQLMTDLTVSRVQFQKIQQLRLSQPRVQYYGGSLPNVNQIGNVSNEFQLLSNSMSYQLCWIDVAQCGCQLPKIANVVSCPLGKIPDVYRVNAAHTPNAYQRHPVVLRKLDVLGLTEDSFPQLSLDGTVHWLSGRHSSSFTDEFKRSVVEKL
ncbi:hypothetical protein F2P81_004066 [Scophthalmus maximus]|uniref:Transducer of regulated CREB activity N-terminal domain-containing protein n=1 Tax=Scophthalmus maximus TaxID=52904 RepID=A0A6A4TCW9_SCOMX|nr:hypothetical protein F2P81_004066 [Scophthalmus maximus]